MYASMMTDELTGDIQENISLIQSWGYKHVDLRWRVLGSAIDELSVSQAKTVHEILVQHHMNVGMLHSSIGKVDHAENPEVIKSQMKKAHQLVSIAPILEANQVRIFLLRPECFCDFGHLDEQHKDWDHVLSLNEPIFRFFAGEGLSIALENAAFHINDALNVVKAFTKYNAGLAWDIMGGWILRDQTEPIDSYFERIAPWIRNVHVKAFALPQYRLNFEMSKAGDTAGVIPWGQFLRTVREAGSNGPLSVETQQVLIRHNSPSVLEANQWLAEFVLSIADDR